MKTLNLLLVLILGIIKTQGQSCNPTSASANLHGNDVRATFLNNANLFPFGDLYYNHFFGVPYQVGQPKVSTVNAGALWFGGRNASGDLLVSAARVESNISNDFRAGPLNATNGSFISNACNDFDRIWQVKRYEIEAHIHDFNTDGMINELTAASILSWPAKGNPHFVTQMGFSLPNQDLAPFFDRNNNGLYEPLLGDYPVFEQGNPDAISEDMLWYVFNDAYTSPSNPKQPLIIEVQTTAYSFYCQEDILLNRSIFVKHKIINRNNITIYDFKVGTWHDMNIGDPNSDFIGCSPNLNTMYAYNSYNIDEAGFNIDYPVYGQNPPVQAITILNHEMTSFTYHRFSTNAPTYGYATSSSEYYNQLNGLWKDGTPITTGGSGYASSTDTTKFAFSGNPYTLQGWSMLRDWMYLPNLANQAILGTVSQDSFLSGEVFQLDLSYSYHRNLDSCYVCNFNLMSQQVPLLQQFYDNGHTLTCTRKEICSNNCVYPGDMNNSGIANDFDLLTYGVAVGQNIMVSPRATIVSDWWPYNPSSPTVNAYIDANGDGAVDSADWELNTIHWSKTQLDYVSTNEGFNTIGNDLFLKRYLNNFILYNKDTISLGMLAAFNVYLGDTTNTLSDVYGLTFRIDYDTSVFILQDNMIYPPFSLGEGWINGSVRKTNELGQLHYVNTRLDGVPVSGGGDLGRVIFRLKNTAPVNQEIMSSQICFSDFKLVNPNGQNIPIGAKCATVNYKDPSFSSVVSIDNTPKYQINLAPNPTDGNTQLLLYSNRSQSVQIQIFDVMGIEVQKMKEYAVVNGEQSWVLNTQELTAGIYFCRVQIGNEQKTLKLVKN